MPCRKARQSSCSFQRHRPFAAQQNLQQLNTGANFCNHQDEHRPQHGRAERQAENHAAPTETDIAGQPADAQAVEERQQRIEDGKQDEDGELTTMDVEEDEDFDPDTDPLEEEDIDDEE